MNSTKNLLVASLVIGTVSDLLFRDSIMHSVPNGLSVLIWSITVTAAITVVLFRQQSNMNALVWLVPFNLACAAYMLRDSPVLHFLDMIVMFVSLTGLSCAARGFELRYAGVVDLLGAGFNVTIDALAQAFPALKHASQLKSMIPPPVRLALPALAKGFAYSIPLLLVFGALFISADPAFAKLVSSGMSLNVGDFSTHMFLLGGFAWLTAGYLSPVLDTSGSESFTVSKNIAIPTIGRLELNVVMAALNLLFLSFVIVQFRYFFSGGGLVAGLSYAEYCRRGFFELSTVSALVLPVLLIIDWLLLRKGDKLDNLFPVQAGFQILMLFVIMTSAVQRMALYQVEFGLTELRFYTSCFIGWLGIIYLIFGCTVLAGRRKQFSYLAVISGFVATAAVQLCNPDRTIMAVNIDRAEHGKIFDVDYALSLSNDATKFMVDNLERLPRPAQLTIANALVAAQKSGYHYDFRSYNTARSQAYSAVGKRLAYLTGLVSQH